MLIEAQNEEIETLVDRLQTSEDRNGELEAIILRYEICAETVILEDDNDSQYTYPLHDWAEGFRALRQADKEGR